MPIITIPEILREKLGSEAAQALVELLNRTGRDTRDEIVLLAEERFGRRLAEAETRFAGRVAQAETRFASALAQAETRFERRLAGEIGALRHDMASLETRLAHRMTGLTRWTSFLWMTGMGLVLTVLFAFFNR